MKKLLILLLSVICFSSCKKTNEEVVASANKKHEEINQKLKDYEQKRVDDLTSLGKGYITGYFRDEEVKKIIAENYTDTFRSFSEYYFDDGMLILVLKQKFIYNKSVKYTEEVALANNDSNWYDDKKTVMEESRFYLSKNKLVKWFTPENKEVPAATTEFINKEQGIWAEAAILLKQLKE